MKEKLEMTEKNQRRETRKRKDEMNAERVKKRIKNETGRRKRSMSEREKEKKSWEKGELGRIKRKNN